MAPSINVSEVRSFLWLARYYHRFVCNFTETTSPITQLLKADHKFVWTEQCQLAFDSIKILLTIAPVLAYLDFTKAFILDLDGCDHNVGVVLSQYNEHGVKHPITYFSHTLLPREEKYHTMQKECLAMVEGMKHFWPYLWGHTFTVCTDHSSLQWLYKAKDGNDWLYR